MAYGVSKLTDGSGDRMMIIPTASDNSGPIELHAWEPVELGQYNTASHDNIVAAELSGYNQAGNHGASVPVEPSTRNIHMPSPEGDSSISSVNTGGLPRGFAAPPTRAASAMSGISSSSTSSPIAGYVSDQKEVVTTWYGGRKRRQITLMTTDIPASCSDNSNVCRDKITSLVDNLARVVRVLNVEWITRLRCMFPLPVIETHFATLSPFESGIQAWQEFFRGHSPGNVGKVFCLLRIAFAAAYLLHDGDQSYSWGSFFENVLQWGGIITNPTEKKIFHEAAHRLLSPPDLAQEGYSQPCCHSTHLARSPRAGSKEKEAEGQYGPTPSVQGLTWHEPIFSSSFDSQATKIELYSALMQGPVSTVCTRYLDCKQDPLILITRLVDELNCRY
jgi:hypothetical protein